MRIAVDARCWHENSAAGKYLRSVIYPLAIEHAEHQFVFLFDRSDPTPIELAPNVERVTVKAKPANSLFFIWWHFIQLRLVLKKHCIDVYIGAGRSTGNSGAIPAVLILHHFNTAAVKLFSTTNYINARLLALSLKKATMISVPTHFIKTAIVEKYQLQIDKVKTTGVSVDASFQPLRWEDREEIKTQYAEGCEYFLFFGGYSPEGNLINTLKAFSTFKKWQKTNMKLLIAGSLDVHYKKQEGKLQTYKYRNEIKTVLPQSEHELAKITAAAYALIFPSFRPDYGTPVVEAMQCEVPVITSVNSSMCELGADAALYVDPANPAELAEQMKRIFKDEQLRTKLVETGKQHMLLHNVKNVQMHTWQLIEQAVST